MHTNDILYQKTQIKVNIPSAYMSANLGSVKNKLSRKSYEQVRKFCQRDILGLRLVGINQAGKTYTGIAILNSSILARNSCYYITLLDLVDVYSKNNYTFPDYILNADILFLDEIGKSYKETANSMEVKVLESLVKKRFAREQRTIFASNSTLDELTGIYGATVRTEIESKTEPIVYLAAYGE